MVLSQDYFLDRTIQKASTKEKKYFLIPDSNKQSRNKGVEYRDADYGVRLWDS